MAARMPAWRRALLAKVRTATDDPKTVSQAKAWLKTAGSDLDAPDFKVVVRCRDGVVRYRLCYGVLGFSAADHNVLAEVTEGTDF